METKNIIWSNYGLNLILNRIDKEDSENKDILMECMYNRNAEFLENARKDLFKILPENIIAIADLGLWDGRRSGYKDLDNNLASVLDPCEDYDTFYVDQNGDVRHESIHHDGTNYILYRQWRPDLSDEQKDRFRAKILSGKYTRRDINRYTVRIGQYVADVYEF